MDGNDESQRLSPLLSLCFVIFNYLSDSLEASGAAHIPLTPKLHMKYLE